MDVLNDKFKVQERILDVVLQENKSLKARVKDLEERVNQVESDINQSDTYIRRNNIEIQGIPSTISKVNIIDSEPGGRITYGREAGVPIKFLIGENTITRDRSIAFANH